MWPFGGKKYNALNYHEARPFLDGSELFAPLNNRVPMAAYVGGTGILVKNTLDAFEPAVYIPENNQVITSIYGEGFYPTDLPVQQMLSAKPNTGAL